MTKRTNRIFAATAAAALAAAALTGCTINIGTGANNTNGSQSNPAAYSDADVMFMQMMIPHHQQAVDMGTLAETRAVNAEVKDLAMQIKDEQRPEIVQMQGLLQDAGASETMGHHMHMDGMLSDSEKSALEKATGAEFDRLYLEGMIAHHEGAIQMANDALAGNKNSIVKDLCDAIIASQQDQITYMKDLLAKL